MPDGDITLGEVSRSLISLETRINGQFSEVKGQVRELNRRFDNLQFVNRETYDVQISALTERVGDLEERNKWLTRTLATAFLVALAAPIIVALVVTRQ